MSVRDVIVSTIITMVWLRWRIPVRDAYPPFLSPVSTGFHWLVNSASGNARQSTRSVLWRVMETGHPSTRAVNSGSGNRALVSQSQTVTAAAQIILIGANVCEQLDQSCYMKLERLGVKPTTSWSGVQRPNHHTTIYHYITRLRMILYRGGGKIWSKARFPLPELTDRVNGPSWRVTGFHYPSTRAVLTGARFH